VVIEAVPLVADVPHHLCDPGENFIPINVSSKSQVLISRLVNNMKADHLAKPYGVPPKSLESHVIRLTMSEERTLNTCEIIALHAVIL
jgi:hypothetical protein